VFPSSLVRAICGSLFLTLLLVPVSRAQQSAAGSIGGTVTDPSGKSVEKAVVTLTNTAQGTVRTFTTQNDGTFSFTTLEAADYTLSAAVQSGFAPWRQSVHLEVGQTLYLPTRLEIAAAKVNVEVADTTQQVNTTSSDLGGVIGAQQIDTLPLNGRNYLELAFLVPGNAPAPNFDPTKEHTVVISSAGQTGRGGNVTIDGADNNDDAVGGSLSMFPKTQFRNSSSPATASLPALAAPVPRLSTLSPNKVQTPFTVGSPFTNATGFLKACRQRTNPFPASPPHSIASNTQRMRAVPFDTTRPGGS
jgi:Carboxypeptidase regulatory-like domain